jgi:hypothetical protein
MLLLLFNSAASGPIFSDAIAAERIAVIGAEYRLTMIAAEDRDTHIEAEERLALIPGESRTVTLQ